MDLFLWMIFVGLLTIPAYMIGAFFAWLWFRRWLPTGHALMVAGAMIALPGLLLPIYGNWETTRRFDAIVRTDLFPGQRIVLAGNIRLDSIDSTEWTKWVARNGVGDFMPSDVLEPDIAHQSDVGICRDTCRKLLQTPGVNSVTVDPVPNATASSPQAVTYRLSAPPCGGVDLCFVRVPPISRFDLHVTESAGRTFDKAGGTGQSEIETRLLPRPLDIEAFEFRDARNRPILRQTLASFRSIKLPLMIAWSLGPYSPHVGFAATERTNRGASDPFRRWTTVAYRPRVS